VKLSQQTDYPWNGEVSIKIEECGGSPFALKLRIPGWAAAATIRVNDRLAEGTPVPASYFELRRVWRPGDVVDLDLPMPSRLMEANPLVEETLDQVALQRGPLVYCLESTDLPKDTRPLEIEIPDNIDLLARYDGRFLGGVVLLEGQALARLEQNWTGRLYRELPRMPAHPVRVRFVPYFAWANRGPSEMTVWLPHAAQ
jgi:DUF1680 family protein